MPLLVKELCLGLRESTVRILRCFRWDSSRPHVQRLQAVARFCRSTSTSSSTTDRRLRKRSIDCSNPTVNEVKKLSQFSNFQIWPVRHPYPCSWVDEAVSAEKKRQNSINRHITAARRNCSVVLASSWAWVRCCYIPESDVSGIFLFDPDLGPCY